MKAQILQHIQDLLTQKIEETKSAIEILKESRNNDTKSSMGDKYETGREMMQIEIDKHELQLGKSKKLLEDVGKIDPSHSSQEIEFGSFVTSNYESYFLSVGMGKIEFDGKVFYAISLASPIGQQLRGKKAGDKFSFNGREIEVKEVA